MTYEAIIQRAEEAVRKLSGRGRAGEQVAPAGPFDLAGE
jgi:hypothetical protein